MPFKDRKKKREYSRGWMRTKRLLGSTKGTTKLLAVQMLPNARARVGQEGATPQPPETTSTHAFSLKAELTEFPSPSLLASKADLVERMGAGKRITAYRFNFPNFFIRVFKRAILLIRTKEIRGNRQEKKEKVKDLRNILGSFSAHYNLVLGKIIEGEWCDNVFEDNGANSFLVPFIEHQGGNFGNRTIYLQLDESHPDKAEMKGRESWKGDDGAEYVFRKLRAEIQEIREASKLNSEALTELIKVVKPSPPSGKVGSAPSEFYR